MITKHFYDKISIIIIIKSFEMNKKIIANIIKYTKNLKVLFIEDDTNSRMQTVKMLENFFDNIDTAVDGFDGINKFEENDYDIIFSDIHMPNLNGLDLTEKVRKKNRYIPIIMISAYDNTPYLLKCIEIGIDGYLIKPIEIDEFLKTLERLIAKLYDTSKELILLEGDFIWNKDIKKLSKTQEIRLTVNETKFLDFLISSNGIVRTYAEIDLFIFEDADYDDRKIRNLVSRLRKKIGSEFLESFYGEGYRVKIIL